MRVKKKVTDTVERKVAALLLQDPEYSAKYLKREVEKTLKKEGEKLQLYCTYLQYDKKEDIAQYIAG